MIALAKSQQYEPLPPLQLLWGSEMMAVPFLGLDAVSDGGVSMR